MIAVATAMALAACSGAKASGDGQSVGEYASGGTFIKAVGGDPGDLNPMKVVALEGWEAISLAYESLIYAEPNGKLVPWLASSWKASGTKVTFTLRKGITCSDGTPFTAKSAAANINYNADPDHATFYYGSQVTEAVKATASRNTLTVTSATNDPFLTQNIGLIMMVCDSGLKNPKALAEKTDGTGLFKLTSVEQGSSYVFTKRNDYTWGPDGVTSKTVGLPDKIELRVIADESTSANLLLSGEINAAPVSGADRTRLDRAKMKSVGVRNSVGEMLFNEHSGRPMADERVREALVLAINRSEVSDVVADGAAIPSVSLITKSPLLCVGDKPKWTLPATDLEQAGRLLDEAGWKPDSSGRRMKNGKPLTIKFIYDAATPSHAPAAELIKQAWDKLGVTTKLSANDSAAWSEQLYQSFDWDTGFVQIAPGGPAVLSTFFAGKTPDHEGLNFMFVDNPKYNKLVAEAKQADPKSTCSLWQDAEAALIDRYDVFPMTDNMRKTYVTGATFDQPNYVQPTTIRMLG